MSFIDETLNDYGGEFTAVGEDKPRWFGIQVRRDDLFSAFPTFVDVAATGLSHSAGLQALPSNTPGLPLRSADKLEATRQAIAQLYASGLPLGLTAKDRLKAINDWHRANGSSEVSTSTILRALRKP